MAFCSIMFSSLYLNGKMQFKPSSSVHLSLESGQEDINGNSNASISIFVNAIKGPKNIKILSFIQCKDLDRTLASAAPVRSCLDDFHEKSNFELE